MKINAYVAFTINLPDRISPAYKLSKKVADKNIYTDSFFEQNTLRCADLISDEVRCLDFDSNEGLFVYRNVMKLALNNPEKIAASLPILARIKEIAETNFPDIQVEKVNANKFPKELRSLIPLIEKWAVSDDEQREQVIQSSSREDLNQLVSEVWPKMRSINAYLDSFKDNPLTEEACLIGNLAELVAELKVNF